MPTIDTILLRLASRIDPRTKATQQLFNDSTAAINVTSAGNSGGYVLLGTASAHGMRTGDECYVAGVTGTTEANNTIANPSWAITRISASSFTVPVAFVNAWTGGGTVTPARIGSSRGNALEPQQILDIYNQARFAAVAALRMKFSNDRQVLRAELGSLVASATVTFSGSNPASGAKPAGYIDFFMLKDGSGTIHLLDPDRAQAMLEGRPSYVQSATNRHVWESGASLLHQGSFVAGATTLYYYGISSFTLTNLLAATSETFKEDHIEHIIELAVSISMGMGGHDLAAYANKLFGVGQ